MSHYAIIIGVDAYASPDWKLGAAVDDALAFREWALGPGGVPPENLHLLLSPGSGRTIDAPFVPAESEHIHELIHQFQRGLGAQGKRLYFYFAGHGSAAPEALDEVSLFPADVRALPRDANRVIGFSQIIAPLQHSGPEEQFFFIDACRDLTLRDFTRGAGPVVGRWRGPPTPETPRRRAQYLLYATSPGGKAVEAGNGVFGRILLQGLRGHPGALLWSGRERRYELRFSRLAEYVRAEVEEQVKRLTGPWQHFLQVPEQDIPPGPSGPKDCLLASFSSEEVGKLPLRVRVQPGPVRQMCGVDVVYYLPGGSEVRVRSVKPEPPAPLPFPVELQLPPGDYTVLAQAEAFGEAREPCALYQPRTVELMLKSVAGAFDPRHPGPLRGDVKHHRGPPTTLIIRSEDPNARIVVVDPHRQTHTGFGSLSLDNPTLGIYCGRLVLPDGTFQERSMEVYPEGPDDFLLRAPPPPLGEMQLGMLRTLGLAIDAHGYMAPSNELGPVAHLRLASLLGFAAFEASVGMPPSGVGGALERMGIHPPPSISPGGSGLLVLLGASGSQPMPGASVPEFLAQSRVSLRCADTGRIVHEGIFEELPRFGAAAQWGQSVASGAWILELSLPHLAPTRYAMAALRDHLSIFVVVAGDSGEVEVQQYMAPLPEFRRRNPGLSPLSMWQLRDLELGQRYLAAGAAVPSIHLYSLLAGQSLDPLLGCVAGYALVREGRQERFRSSQPQNIAGHPAPSVMQDMLRHFDELPDAHLLAGLCEPQHQAAHFKRAMERGLPLFADGLRLLRRHAVRDGKGWLAQASRGLLPGSSWSAWVVR